MNPKEEVKKIVDIMKKEDKEKEIALQRLTVRQRFEEDELKKKEKKLTEDFSGTGIEVLFGELINQKVVSNAEVGQPMFNFRRAGGGEASMNLIFNHKSFNDGDSDGWSENQISAIYSDNGLVIKGEKEFSVGIDCSLSEAIINALKNPMYERRSFYNGGRD